MFIGVGGFLTGLAFGFILHRSGLTRYSRIIGTLLLRDLKALKFMFTTLSIAAIGYGLAHLTGSNIVQPIVNPYLGLAHLIGGGIFGVGIGLSGL